jgi:hypothetical protein
MTEERWYAGVDWASESHLVFLTDGTGRKIGEKYFKHGGDGLAEMAAWLMAASGAACPGQIHAASEVPHGPVVETLLERGFKVHAINPKQMDRFRDRFTVAGAKDDSRDGEAMASALRTDPHCFRLLAPLDPTIIELREWSRMAEDLGTERNRLTNRLRQQLWRYFPAMLELEGDLDVGGHANARQGRACPRDNHWQDTEAKPRPAVRCRSCAFRIAQTADAGCRRYR